MENLDKNRPVSCDNMEPALIDLFMRELSKCGPKNANGPNCLYHKRMETRQLTVNCGNSSGDQCCHAGLTAAAVCCSLGSIFELLCCLQHVLALRLAIHDLLAEILHALIVDAAESSGI